MLSKLSPLSDPAVSWIVPRVSVSVVSLCAVVHLARHEHIGIVSIEYSMSTPRVMIGIPLQSDRTRQDEMATSDLDGGSSKGDALILPGLQVGLLLSQLLLRFFMGR